MQANLFSVFGLVQFGSDPLFIPTPIWVHRAQLVNEVKEDGEIQGIMKAQDTPDRSRYPGVTGGVVL